MSKTLREAQQEIFNFINEAEECLKNGCGYSAVMTIFSVILCVSEAVLGNKAVGKRIPEKILINNFIDQMIDKDWFLSKTSKNPTDNEFKEFLIELRNGLSHQLSLPQELGLIPTAIDLNKLTQMDVLYCISVEGFINSVKNTIIRLINDDKYSTKIIDPNFGSFKLTNKRDLGSRMVVRCLDGYSTIASAAVTVIAKTTLE